MSKKKPAKRKKQRNERREFRHAIKVYAELWLKEDGTNYAKDYIDAAEAFPVDEPVYRRDLAAMIVESMEQDGFELDWEAVIAFLMKILPLLLLFI